jgi:hypothetical protein
VFFDCAAAVEYGVEHADSKVEYGQWPDASDAEADAPDGTVVGLVTGHEDDQED